MWRRSKRTESLRVQKNDSTRRGMNTTFDATEPLFFIGDEIHGARLGRLREEMRKDRVDALLLLKHDSVRFVTGFYAKGYRPFLEFDYLALVPLNGKPVLGTALP